MDSVFIPIPINTVTEEEEKPSLTYKLDLAAGRIVGQIDGLEAVNQAIQKAIITPRFKCLIYDNQYGSEIIDAIIAQDATPEYKKTVILGFIKDALKPDTRILDVYDFQIEFLGDCASIFLKVDTIFGETEIKAVI